MTVRVARRSGAHALRQGVPFWVPAILGAALYDMWDAEDATKLTLVGSAVSAWASAKNAYSAAQGVGAARPLYSATSFNGRPGVTFDGSDDELTYAGVGNFPTGAGACEIWLLIDQTALPADTATRSTFAYGAAAATTRGPRRIVTSGVNRAQSLVGTGTTTTADNGTVDFSGRHVVRQIISGSATQADVDGIAGSSTAATPTTATTRTRIGAGSNTAAAGFVQGVISFVAVTAPLSTHEAGQMTAYLKARGGIV